MKIKLLLVLISLLIEQTYCQGPSNYVACITCLHNKFYDGSYYCKTGNGACRAANDARCNFQDTIYKF